MQQQQPRPVDHLNLLMRAYPSVSRHVELFLSGRGADLPDWAAWCFLPMSAWYSMVSVQQGQDRLPLHLVGDVPKLAALGTWRYSQGIYRLQPDMLAALTSTPMSGSLPVDVFYRLPQYCVYLETPGLTWQGDALHGFFAHLEHDMASGRAELRFLLDCEQGLSPFLLHLGPWTITEAVDRAGAEALRQGVKSNLSDEALDALAGADEIQNLAQNLNPLISLLLYLCSDAPEIDGERTPGVFPSHPAPQKVKRGWRLFPPPQPTIWLVGEATGQKLHLAAQSSNSNPASETGRSVKAHIRRGHWHGYWTGPKKDSVSQRFVLHWLYPQVVGVVRE